jgi:hypothetical protein
MYHWNAIPVIQAKTQFTAGFWLGHILPMKQLEGWTAPEQTTGACEDMDQKC